MKEKSKKILKGFGVGALACLGMFGLTGCANIDVSQKKVDSLIERFEDYSEKTTREEILNLYHTAYYNAMTQTNGYDNVVITGKTANDVDNLSYSSYCNSEMSMLFGNVRGALAAYYYDFATDKVIDAGFYLTNQGYVCTYKEIEDSFDASGLINRIRAELLVINFKDEELAAYKVLKNGNYSLRFITEERKTYYSEEKEEELGEFYVTTYYTIEITKDAKIVSMKAESDIDVGFECEEQDWQEIKSYSVEIEAEYLYGTVDVELLQELYELAQATPEDGNGE